MPTLTNRDLAAYRHDPVAALAIDPTLAIGTDRDGRPAFLRLKDGDTRCRYCRARWTVDDGPLSGWSFETAGNGRVIGTCQPCAHDSYW